MVGWLTIGQGWTTVEYTTIMDVPVRHVEIARPWRESQRSWMRQLRRGCKLLCKGGCRRVLTQQDFPYWPVLQGWGLRPIDPTPFCQCMAVPLVLKVLEEQGIPPYRATVLLTGERAVRPMVETAQILCPQVPTLMIQAPRGGTNLCQFLREEYGVAVLEGDGGMSPHVVVEFSPTTRPKSGTKLQLWRGGIDLAGHMISWGESAILEGVDNLSLVSFLWELGRIPREEVRIIPTSCGTTTA